MSADYYLGLVGELPDLRALDSRVADFGGVEGDWTKGIEIGGVTVHRLALDEREDALEFLEQSLRENDKPSLPITSILILSRGPFEAVDSVGGVLVALCGGVLANEDGDVMQYEPGPRPLEPPSPSPLLDVSIPPLVEQQFANEQQLYAVAARKQPSVHFQALVKKLSMKPERVGHGAGGVWEANSIGQLVLKQHLPHELHHWSSELTAIGCPAPTSLFRLSFAYWHVKSVSDRDWRDMLAVVCGLARLTDGVVYRIAAPSEAHFDFAPREQISSATEGSRPKAPRDSFPTSSSRSFWASSSASSCYCARQKGRAPSSKASGATTSASSAAHSRR